MRPPAFALQRSILRRGAHDLSGNTQRLIGIEESHSRNRVVHFADGFITISCWISGEIVMDHTWMSLTKAPPL